MTIDIYQKTLTYSFIAIIILSLFIAMLRFYMLRRIKESQTTKSEKVHNTIGYEQYITQYNKDYRKLHKASLIVLFIAVIPVMIFIFIMTTIITGNEIMGVICAIIVYFTMTFTLRNRIFINQ